MEAYGWLIWMALMVLFAAVEAATVSLVSLWFVGGSLAAMVVCLLGGSPLLQVLSFVLVSAALRPEVCYPPKNRHQCRPCPGAGGLSHRDGG